MNQIYNILSYFSAYFSIVPFLIGIYRRKYSSHYDKIVFLFIFFSGFTELACYLFSLFFKKQNILILNSYIIIETVILSLFYYKIFVNKHLRLATLFFAVFFVIMSIQQILVNNEDSMSNISFTTESIAISLFSVLQFHYLLKNSVYSNIISVPLFWYNSAFLLFFSGNLFLHLFSQFLQEYAQKAFYELWGFHSILNIILYVLISIGFWKTKTSQT